MSKLENRIKNILTINNIDFEEQRPVPLDEYPWKTKQSKTSPKSDLYLPQFDLYVEIKGFMTFQAVSKLSFLSRQNFRYYIFQGTETQWNPYIESYLINYIKKTTSISNGIQLENNIKHQLSELINLNNADHSFLNNISGITLRRLKSYIDLKINEYVTWNGEWY
jgi:hypothetical protein